MLARTVPNTSGTVLATVLSFEVFRGRKRNTGKKRKEKNERERKRKKALKKK